LRKLKFFYGKKGGDQNLKTVAEVNEQVKNNKKMNPWFAI
jgi:hypothetical protein